MKSQSVLLLVSCILMSTISRAQSIALTASIAPKQLQTQETAASIEPSSDKIKALHAKLKEKERRIAKLQGQLHQNRSSQAPAPRRASLEQDDVLDPSSIDSVPYQAKAGQCYAKIEKDEGEYKVATEKELVREAHTKVVIVPAKFAWVDEKITIEEPAEDLVRVPAQYKTVQEKVLVRPARTVWKKGSSLLANAKILDQKKGKGEVLCLVEEPAVYQTVSKKVLAEPEHVKKVSIPGKYRTLRVKKLIEPAREETVEVPAEYREVAKKVALKAPQYAWTRVVCETNLTKKNVEAIQVALKNKNTYRGPINGKIDEHVLSAALQFAQERGLPHGQRFIAMEVIDALNIKL